MTTADTWANLALDHVHAAAPGLDRLITALATTRAVCEDVGAEHLTDPPFAPAHGWLTTEGLLALLELTWPLPTTPQIELAGCPDLPTAAQAIRLLLRQAADDVLIELDAMRLSPDPTRAAALDAVMYGLDDGHQLIFGRSW